MTSVPHIPGQTPRPAEGSIRPGLNEGLGLYRAGYYWEAHEAWEPLWLRAKPNSRERAFLQGIIQLANGWLKIAMNKPIAAHRIALLAEEHLGRAGAEIVLEQDPAWAGAELSRLKAQATDSDIVQNNAVTSNGAAI